MVTFLVGSAVGIALALSVIFGAFKVQTKVSWEEGHQLRTAVCWRVFALTAENAQLRVSLASGEMTEDGKKIAAMTMAALDNVIAAAEEAIQGGTPSPALISGDGA